MLLLQLIRAHLYISWRNDGRRKTERVPVMCFADEEQNFRREMTVTIFDDLNTPLQIRLQEAAELLRQTKQGTTDIKDLFDYIVVPWSEHSY